MLDDAAAAFLDSVSERGFDEPLLALLRAQGFTEVHLVHGAREFGKDVIARRNGEQWAWQSKAGDIGHSEWRQLVGQLDELRLVNLGHGAFDTRLPRHPVLVTTGRLVGNAPELYRDYNERARDRGEPELDLWTRDDLIGFLAGNPDAILRGSFDGELLAQIGAIDAGRATLWDLEVFSRRWTVWDIAKLASLGVVEASLLCERLHTAERDDLASHLALCLLRGAWAGEADDTAAATVSDAAGALFERYADSLAASCDDGLLAAEAVVAYSGTQSWVTYPVRCVRVAELIALLAIRVEAQDIDRAAALRRWLVSFVVAQPGCAHPISDRYAVSVIPISIVLAQEDRDAAVNFLKSVTIWLADAYDDGRLGLGGVDASPAEEIERLIGSAFEIVERNRRRGSLLATVILDLCAALSFEELYTDVHNDIEAVRIHPQMLRMGPGRDQYSRTGLSNRLDPNVDFAEELGLAEPVAPHHRDEGGRALVDRGRYWDLLGISSALRDRYFWRAIRAAVRHLPEMAGN